MCPLAPKHWQLLQWRQIELHAYKSCYTTAEKLSLAFYSLITWLGHPFQLIGFVFRVEYKLWTCQYPSFVLHVHQFQVRSLNCDIVMSVDRWIISPCGTSWITRDLKQRRFWATAANQSGRICTIGKRLCPNVWVNWLYESEWNRPLRSFQDKLLYLVGFPSYPSPFRELRDKKKKLKKLQFWPKSFLAKLKYWYIEHGILKRKCPTFGFRQSLKTSMPRS